ncbi:hypothetical protein Vafri_4003, partial [Volvox africanus]
AAAICEPSAPPAVVELLPLPEGIPEELPVLCCGRRAVLMLRTQRVQYEGALMPVANFEKICGRGDAKKWKSSLWLVDEYGNPVRQVGDLLAEKKVDRNALTRLMSNAAQYEAYAEWQQQQQQQHDEQRRPEGREELMPDCAADRGVSGGVNSCCDVADVTAHQVAVGEARVEGVRGEVAVGPSGDEREGAVGITAEAALTRDGIGGSLSIATAAAVGNPMEMVVVQEGAPGGRGAAEWGEVGSGAGYGAAAAEAEAAVVEGTDIPAEATATGDSGDGGSAALIPPPSLPTEPLAAVAEPKVIVAGKDAAAVIAEAMEVEAMLPPTLVTEPNVEPDVESAGMFGVTATLGGGGAAPAGARDATPGPFAAAQPSSTPAAGVQPDGGGADGLESTPAPADIAGAVGSGGVKRLRLFHLDHVTRRALMSYATEQGLVRLPRGCATTAPEACVGHCCRIYWTGDNEWYDADVQVYDEQTGRHFLWYHLDEATEWIDLGAEEREGRIQWLPYNVDP